MKWINYFVVLSISLSIIQGCQSSITDEKKIEEKIITKFREDIPYLANLQAIYSINYINYQDNRVLGQRIPFRNDDFYIRNDVATVFYGYSLKDAEIKVITDNNQRILQVKLPQPQKIATDRANSTKVNDKRFKPLDEKGQPVDVEKYINSRLDEATKVYEERTISSTREMSQQYFQNIADRFGLKLQLEFI